MRRYKGYVLALVGFVILVASLVMSTPFAGHGEPKTKPTRGPRTAAPAKLAEVVAVPAAEELDPDFFESIVTPVQETGPILFKEGELETYLTFPVPASKPAAKPLYLHLSDPRVKFAIP